MCVHSNYRRQGLMKMLLKHILNDFCSLPGETISLQVIPESPSWYGYRMMGFRLIDMEGLDLGPYVQMVYQRK